MNPSPGQSPPAAPSPERARSRARLWTWIAVLGTPLGLLACYAIMLWRAEGDYLWLGIQPGVSGGLIVLRLEMSPAPRYERLQTIHPNSSSSPPIVAGSYWSDFSSTRLSAWSYGWGGGVDAWPLCYAGAWIDRNRELPAAGGQHGVPMTYFAGEDALPQVVMFDRFPVGALTDFLAAWPGHERAAAARELAKRFPTRSTPLFWWIASLLHENDLPGAKALLRERRDVFLSDTTFLGQAYLVQLEAEIEAREADPGRLPRTPAMYSAFLRNSDQLPPWPAFVSRKFLEVVNSRSSASPGSGGPVHSICGNGLVGRPNLHPSSPTPAILGGAKP